MAANARSTPSNATSATLLAISSLTVMANATIAPSLPGLKDAFADTPAITTLTGLVMTLPSLSVVLVAWAVGMFADKMDQRRLLLIGLVVYALAGTSAFFANDMTSLLIGRIGLGVGVAIVMTVAAAMIAELWAGEARQKFMGLQGAAMSAGGMTFLLLGGALAEFHWRQPFLLYLLALPIAVATLAFLPKRPPDRTISSKLTGKLPVTSVLTVCLIAIFSMVVFYLIPTKLPFRLREIGVDSPAIAGAAVAAMTASSIPSALAYNRLRQKLGPLHIFAVCFSLMAAGYYLVFLASNPTVIFAGSTVIGIGSGALMPNLMAMMMAETPDTVRGRAAGALTTSIFLGQFLSPLVSGPIVTAFGLPTVFQAAALSLAAATIAMLAMDRFSRPGTTPDVPKTMS